MLELVDALAAAVMARDVARVQAIVNGPGSTALPQRVREEALSLVLLPLDSLRAPISLWAFRHQTCGSDPAQLDLPLMTA